MPKTALDTNTDRLIHGIEIVGVMSDNSCSPNMAMNSLKIPVTSGYRALNDFEPNVCLREALERLGVNEEYLASKLAILLEAKTIKKDKNGKIYEFVNMDIQIRALEICLKLFS